MRDVPNRVIAVRDDFALSGKAHDHVCFDEFGFQFFAVSLGQAARDDDAATSSIFFVFCGVHYCCNGFFFGWLDESAGVDDDDIGVFRVVREVVAVELEEVVHALGIDGVFGAAQGDEVDCWHSVFLVLWFRFNFWIWLVRRVVIL